MRDKEGTYRHEHLGLQFLLALQLGDPATLAALWQQAERDPLLEELFENVLEHEPDAVPDCPQPADEKTTIPSESPPSLPAGKLTLPLLPTVIVRHYLPSTEEPANQPQPRHATEFPRNAGPLKKTQ